MPAPLTKVWVGRNHLLEMTDDAESHFPHETGGVLMGYWASDREAVVTAIIKGGPKAQRTPTRFSPDSKFQEENISNIYQRSGRRHTYLGDWHTHPGGELALSFTDKSTLHVISRTPEARARKPIMLIVAGDGSWMAGAWQWHPSKVFWRRLKVCEIVFY
jgi:integrative and conjugative element protein (TIGR02256 family)